MKNAGGPPDLSHVETWIFDLDNTLYPSACNLFAEIDRRMTAFIAAELKIAPQQARVLQKAYYFSHGTTLCGLIAEHGIDPEAFLAYVHDIDLSPVAPMPELARALDALPGRKLVYTNGSRRHAERVIERLGLSAQFAAVHDIVAAAYCPKPRRAAYERLIAAHAIRAERAAMFEDIVRNLEVPHALGMTTVLITGEKPWDRSEEDDLSRPPACVHYIAADLAAFLAGARAMSYERATQDRPPKERA